MTAARNTFRSRNRRRRVTGAMLLAGLWLKVFVVALGLAQPARADVSGARTAERELLAALHVICTSGGVKVLGSSGNGGGAPASAGMDLLDCARCCSVPVHGLALTQDAFPVQMAAHVRVPPPPRSLAGGQVFDNPGNPRAPPGQGPA